MPETKETLLKFPCAFPFKIFGEASDEFVKSVGAIFAAQIKDFDTSTIKISRSSGKRYMALTVTITATSQNNLDALYQALTKNPLVKMVL